MVKKQTIRKYYDEIVIPTVNEFLQSYHAKCDTRKAVLAALVLNHITDHMAELQNMDFSQMKAMVEQECPETKVLREISNITKHRYLGNTQITQKHSPGLFQRPFGSGHFAQSSHVYLKGENEHVNIPFAVEKVLSYWNQKINSLP
ncbi:MAG: hypothetical protein ACRCWR_08350 [Saezia sp.]